MWNGSYLSGLFLIDTETGYKKRYSTQNGLIHNSVFGISEDNEGNIWIASFRGLSRLNPESDHITNFRFSIGDLRDPNILFTDSDGWLQLAIENGLITFDPEKLTASPVPPATVIESVSYRNDMNRDTIVFAYGKSQLELRYNENKVSFQYVCLHYANAEQNQYAYKLDGYDKEWIKAGTQRSATYTNLSPGKYTFSVKSANSDGVWNETVQSISIRISPPWWLTWWAYAVYGLMFIAIVIAIDGIQRRRLAEKANQKAKEKELEQAREIEKAYNKLKATQSQLIQSEKMASLGELTAGIAHEIQNPLNFVNNFSEVSGELIDEMIEELEKGEVEEAKEIAADIKLNLEKINHHGKRADAIVKGMLQHSRSSSGVKEPTDINALADEYLRLAYHGLRAKDKSFNASMKTNFDPAIGNINVIPQDMGRVILNLITNAFYAVDEKKKMQTLEGFEDYEPTVSVSTEFDFPPPGGPRGVKIYVTDNGNGIPQNIVDKIFQPFFTTKPAGQGTGLGLSMSYDIVKAHGGELKVETKEGEGTSFTIFLAI
jgi:signal transduction histidine kinase